MRRKIPLLAVLFVSVVGGARVDAAPIAIGSRLELLADGHMIDSLAGDARHVLHEPMRQEIAVNYDAPWEGNGSNYPTVFRDGDKYRMYYRGMQFAIAEGSAKYAHPVVTCYAESPDGIQWEKPKLGLFEFEGSKQNNIIWTGHASHNFTPFRDTNPDAPATERYKAIGGEGAGGLVALASADGLRWTSLQDKPLIDPAQGTFDSQNVVFWDAERKEYRIYFRDFRNGLRDIKTATSQDFRKWTEAVFLKYQDAAATEELYTNQIKPYYRAPHLFLGLPTRYVDRGRSRTLDQLPEPDHRRLRSSVQQRYGSALTDTLLMTSRDGQTFHRWGDAFIRPGPERPGTWNYGHLYTAWGFVETAAPIPGMPNELSIYATEGAWTGKESQLRRYTLRVDGFASLHASSRGGEMRTKPLIFSGKELVLNFATSASGDIRIAIHDKDNQPIKGFGLEDCDPVFGDTLERQVRWKGEADISHLAGQEVRLRFVLKDADLYSFRFR